MQDITLWDFDTIESHNIPNQAFPISMIGENKAEALASVVRDATNIEYETKGKWNGERLGGLVLCCVDSMQVRRSVLSKMNKGTFIETRMGVSHGQIFSIDSRNKEDRAFWRKHWAGDDIIEEKSACGTSLTIGSTAQLLSSHVAWQVIKHLNGEKLVRGMTVCVTPLHIEEF